LSICLDRQGRSEIVSEATPDIVFDDEMAMPRLSTAFEVVAPMRSAGLLAESGRRDDRRRDRHQVGRLPGLQT
jgi:hypothetical protein